MTENLKRTSSEPPKGPENDPKRAKVFIAFKNYYGQFWLDQLGLTQATRDAIKAIEIEQIQNNNVDYAELCVSLSDYLKNSDEIIFNLVKG